MASASVNVTSGFNGNAIVSYVSPRKDSDIIWLGKIICLLGLSSSYIPIHHFFQKQNVMKSKSSFFGFYLDKAGIHTVSPFPNINSCESLCTLSTTIWKRLSIFKPNPTFPVCLWCPLKTPTQPTFPDSHSATVSPKKTMKIKGKVYPHFFIVITVSIPSKPLYYMHLFRWKIE